jgi:hypothetical protein
MRESERWNGQRPLDSDTCVIGAGGWRPRTEAKSGDGAPSPPLSVLSGALSAVVVKRNDEDAKAATESVTAK